MDACAGALRTAHTTVSMTPVRDVAVDPHFKRARLSPAAHGLTPFASALCGWNPAVPSSAAFAASNSSSL
jgi:hypothetical protein